MWRPCSVFSSTFEVWYLTSSQKSNSESRIFSDRFTASARKSTKETTGPWEHASATTHATRSIQQFNAINKIPSLPQALYKSNLSPGASFFLLSKLKVSLKWHNYKKNARTAKPDPSKLCVCVCMICWSLWMQEGIFWKGVIFNSVYVVGILFCLICWTDLLCVYSHQRDMKLILLPVQNCSECLLEYMCTPHFCWDLIMRDVLVYLNENKAGYHF